MGECSVLCKVRSELLRHVLDLRDPAKRLRMCVLVDAARRETLESEIKSAGQWKMHLLSTN